MRSVLSRLAYADKDEDVVGNPDPRIIGAATTMLEEGEDDAALSPTRIAADAAPEPGPGIHP